MSADEAATVPVISERSRLIARWVVLVCIFFVAADLAYKAINNITYATRDRCILYRTIPKPAFLFFEYFVELSAMVVVGIFLAKLIEVLFSRYKSFYPRSPATAFLYGSVVPLCACAVIPMVRSMRDKLPLRTTIAFVLAAPLLSPTIISLSFTVLGPTYGVLRIVSAFLVAVLGGYVVERWGGVRWNMDGAPATACGKSCCPLTPRDYYVDTLSLFRQILPYVLIGGAAGMFLEMLSPLRTLTALRAAQGPWGSVAVILLGAPLYLCNGAEVLLLRPLVHVGGVSMGTAVGFSVTSTAVCVTSFAMLMKFLGTRAAVVLLAHVVGMALLLSFTIDWLLAALS